MANKYEEHVGCFCCEKSTCGVLFVISLELKMIKKLLFYQQLCVVLEHHLGLMGERRENDVAERSRTILDTVEGMAWRKLHYGHAKLQSTAGSSIILAAFGMVRDLDIDGIINVECA